MADEADLTLSAVVEKLETVWRLPSKTWTFDMAGSNVIDVTQNIGTSAENIVVGDSGATPLVIAIYLGTSNYVELGHDSTGFVATKRLNVGDPPAVFRLPAGYTLQGRTNTLAANTRFFIIPL